MDNYQIFISYRRDGGDALAGRLADRLSASGYRVFFDVESMRSGTFNTQILDAIEQCNDIILVLPPNGLDRCVNNGDWVRQELAFALKHNKNIIPIMMRGFNFPQILPADIDKIRYMEGITASSEYFDAVVEKIKNLLVSNSQATVLSERKLETKEFFKIKTPLFNIYKQNSNTPKGFLNITIFTEKLFLTNNKHFHWSPPVIENHTINSLRDFIAFGKHEHAVNWYDKNSKKLESLQKTIKELKNYSDLYFYNNALIFAMGSMYTLPGSLLRTYPSCIVELFCYCMDLPGEQFGALEETFRKDNHCYEEFRNNLPLALDAWGTSYKAHRLNSDYLQKFDTFGILLFEFMTDLSILILDTVKDSELDQIRTGQIRSYYKWLKKNKIYLPKELQEKIYKYL